MPTTLLLDTRIWDLCLDATGDIALASPPYSVAQDVCSATRTFLGECWYDTSIGVPYLQQILGQFPTLSLVKSLIAKAAATVPGCGNPVVVITRFQQRALSGNILFTDTTTQAQVTVSFAPGAFNVGISSVGGPDIVS